MLNNFDYRVDTLNMPSQVASTKRLEKTDFMASNVSLLASSGLPAIKSRHGSQTRNQIYAFANPMMLQQSRDRLEKLQ